MSNQDKPTTNIVKPSKGLLKRIDIGLVTGICAVFISFWAIIIGKEEISSAVEANKVMVLPIIDIDLGYVGKPNEKGVEKQFFEVTLSNVGAGIAHVQKVEAFQKGKAIKTYKEFEAAVMTGRMRSWSRLTEKAASGYLPAGEKVSPISLNLGAGESDLSAYLSGRWGAPMDGVDINVCYCSMYKGDCWTVNYLDRKVPQKVKHCGIDDQVQDVFQDYKDQRAEARTK